MHPQTQEIERAIAHLDRHEKLHLMAVLARSLLRGAELAKPLDRPADRDRSPGNPPVNPIAALLESDFIGCAGTADTHLSRDDKTDLTAILETKHGHR